jgi:hypothetical protein
VKTLLLQVQQSDVFLFGFGVNQVPAVTQKFLCAACAEQPPGKFFNLFYAVIIGKNLSQNGADCSNANNVAVHFFPVIASAARQSMDLAVM